MRLESSIYELVSSGVCALVSTALAAFARSSEVLQIAKSGEERVIVAPRLPGPQDAQAIDDGQLVQISHTAQHSRTEPSMDRCLSP